jgi:hypothetical protein
MLYGRAIHKALETWYTLLAKKETAPTRAAETIASFKTEMESCRGEYLYEDSYNEDLLRGVEALQHYGIKNSFERWTVIDAPEMELRCFLPNGAQFTGRIDLVVRSPEGIVYIIDHKTTSWGIGQLTQTLQVSDQANAYLLLWNRTFPDLQTTSVVFNVIRQFKSTVELKQILVMKTFEDVERFANDAAQLTSEITQKAMSDHGVWVMNTGSCYLYNRPCPYLQLCKGMAWQPLIGTEYKMRESRGDNDAE